MLCPATHLDSPASDQITAISQDEHVQTDSCRGKNPLCPDRPEVEDEAIAVGHDSKEIHTHVAELATTNTSNEDSTNVARVCHFHATNVKLWVKWSDRIITFGIALLSAAIIALSGYLLSQLGQYHLASGIIMSMYAAMNLVKISIRIGWSQQACSPLCTWMSIISGYLGLLQVVLASLGLSVAFMDADAAFYAGIVPLYIAIVVLSMMYQTWHILLLCILPARRRARQKRQMAIERVDDS